MIEEYKIDKEINGFGQLGTLCNGGRGSGNFGHAGRPGKVGGAAPSGSGGGSYGRLGDDFEKVDKRVQDTMTELASIAKTHASRVESWSEEQQETMEGRMTKRWEEAKKEAEMAIKLFQRPSPASREIELAQSYQQQSRLWLTGLTDVAVMIPEHIEDDAVREKYRKSLQTLYDDTHTLTQKVSDAMKDCYKRLREKQEEDK